VEEYHGTKTALPVYALAGLIGWSRIDERDHDLSDVVFGAALGYVIGKSVARQHKERESQLRLVPYSHPLEPASGLAAEWRF
jgi:membrane-associated phospholipid phosphatase